MTCTRLTRSIREVNGTAYSCPDEPIETVADTTKCGLDCKLYTPQCDAKPKG